VRGIFVSRTGRKFKFSGKERAVYRPRYAGVRRRSDEGAVLVEYAFVFIMFLTLIFGISAFGHALFVYHSIDHVVREATRYAAVRGYTCGNDSSCTTTNSASGINGQTNTADVEAFVASITPQSVDSSKFTYNICGVSDSGVCAASPTICSSAVLDANGNSIGPWPAGYPGCTVSVQVGYPYTFIFPFLPNLTTTTAPCTQPGVCLSSKSQMIIVH
jgi:Flp pilus assembly protein TadG